MTSKELLEISHETLLSGVCRCADVGVWNCCANFPRFCPPALAPADTMVDAIALTSPDGRMSKRARKAAEENLASRLFPGGLPAPCCPQPTEKEALLRQAADLRLLASRGITPRKLNKRADELERQANAL